MPGVVEGALAPKKRKRVQDEDTLAPKSKVSKKPRSKTSGDGTEVEDIEQLEAEIQASQRNYNNIATLLLAAKSLSSPPRVRNAALLSLCRVFCRFIADGRLTRAESASANEAKIVEWLKARFNDYRALLNRHLLGSEVEDITLSLTLSMQFVREELASSKASPNDVWRTGTFAQLLHALVVDSKLPLGVESFVEQYANAYDDVRYQTLAIISRLASSGESASVTANVLSLLTELSPPPTNGEKLSKFFYKPVKALAETQQKQTPTALAAHQKVAEKAWLAVLARELAESQRKVVLQMMSTTITPWMTHPSRLMDFLTDSFNAGGATSLLALSGMFSLMTEQNLDYPSFYPRLYSLLDDKVLHSTHRSRFFRLLDNFLSSTHLPANMVASFIKRISRLALHGPPAAIVAVVPWVYNMLKTHPTCTFMIHRVPRVEEERAFMQQYGAEDPFNAEEADPMLTGAIESSLWELETLQSHYHPNVASLAKIMGQQFTKKSYNLEDFLDHSYQGLIESELAKAIKKTPVIEFDIPKHIFTTDEGDATLAEMMTGVLQSSG